MNCRDVTWILDNQKGVLEPAQRREVESHVAGCADCASAWRIQTGLADLPYMALPADFASHCRVVVAAAPASIARRPVINRRFVVGALTALAAAAALFLILPRQSGVVMPADHAPRAATAGAAPVVPDAAPTEAPVDLPPPEVIEASATPHFLVRVMPLTPPTDAQSATGSSGSSAFPAALQEQLRANAANDPSRNEALQSLHAALIEELRKVPGLVLVDSDLAILEPSSSRKYQLRISGVTMLGPDGKVMPRDARYVPVNLSAEQVRADGKNLIRLPMGGAAIDLLAACSTDASGTDTSCRDVRGSARTMVRQLREQVFPPDASVTRGLLAKLRDALLDATQRSKSLFDFLKIQDNTGDTGLLRDPAVVRAVIDLAATADPALRARIWRAMRGVGSKDLIQPLMSSVVNDPVETRLAALETLADFRDDQRVRATLESIALGDPRPMVRAVAERGLSGEGPWRQYVVTSLKDASLPAPERTEALMYYLYPPGPGERAPSHPDYWQIMQEVLDDAAVTALAKALPNAGSLRGASNNFVGNFAARNSKNPAVTEMLLTFLENDKRPVMRAVAGQMLAQQHADEPRVREALTKAMQSDPDAMVRDAIRPIMAAKPPF